mmetsp:Transcript_49327/g.130753  ORF Transcript_49327/g.130753 Transcript_49327/m.130753 type:complete len:224 (+) Transcript_49327:178-849(+)
MKSLVVKTRGWRTLQSGPSSFRTGPSRAGLGDPPTSVACPVLSCSLPRPPAPQMCVQAPGLEPQSYPRAEVPRSCRSLAKEPILKQCGTPIQTATVAPSVSEQRAKWAVPVVDQLGGTEAGKKEGAAAAVWFFLEWRRYHWLPFGLGLAVVPRGMWLCCASRASWTPPARRALQGRHGGAPAAAAEGHEWGRPSDRPSHACQWQRTETTSHSVGTVPAVSRAR